MSKKSVGLFDLIRAELKAGLSDKYANMAYNVFEWDGFPRSMPRKYPERWLYEDGLCTVFFPKGSDEPVCLQVAMESIRNNFYGEPTEWRAIPVAGENFDAVSYKLTPENAVLIRNNDTYRATRPYVDVLIDQLVNVELTMRMNINAQKVPYIFKSPNGTSVLQNKNDYKALMECDPVWFKTQFSSDDVEVFQTGVPLQTDGLITAYTEYDSRILEYLGVNNIPIEKKERLLVDEVTANEEELNLGVKSRLEQRRVACENMGDVLGLDVTCRYSSEDMMDRFVGKGADDSEVEDVDTEGE